MSKSNVIPTYFFCFALVLAGQSIGAAQDASQIVAAADRQPLEASVKRVVQALQLAGSPLEAKSLKRLEELSTSDDDPKLGWSCGDHHVLAAGCAHYENPTEGVKPEDMMRHLDRARVAGTRQVAGELIVNGELAAKQLIDADGDVKDLTFDIDMPQSAWFAVRILPSMHSNRALHPGR